MATKTHEELQAEVTKLRTEQNTFKNAESAGETITIGGYLVERLAQLEVTSMFGVPGDFNLGFLDLVEDHPKIDWIGNCNELNAAYAADGYARVKPLSLGAITTTFGVGELSATNGIAGAFSEMVPVLHIVGVPQVKQQKAKTLLHHTLGDGRFDAYLKAAELFTVAQASLTDKDTAAAEIDRVITACITRARPAYLMLPTDLVFEKIPSKTLSIPLSRSLPPNDPATEEFILNEIVELVHKADDDVVVLADACSIRHDVRAELKDFLIKTGFPVYAAPMGKTSVPEDYERYGGIYVGSISHPEVKEKVESAKLILSVGALKSDFNTGNFTYNVPRSKTVELHSEYILVQYASFPGIGMKALLPKLTERLQSLHHKFKQIPVPPFVAEIPKEDNQVISHDFLWPRVGKFLKNDDVVVAETGTSSFGILDVPFPKGAVFVSQILWGSIGWTVGSTLGAALAARDLGMGRTILFVGDGSLQLTVQELSTMLRAGVKPIIFVLNNKGYTIERFLHGWNRKYNDISDWNIPKLLSVLGDADGTLSKSYTVSTKDELSILLDDPSFAAAEKMQLVELIMEKHDAPRALKAQADLSGKANKYAETLETRG